MASLTVSVSLDGADGSRHEARVGAEKTGLDEAEQRPDLVQAVLHGCAGQRQPEAGLQRSGCLGSLGIAVLDRLGLVQHGRVPRHGRQAFLFMLEQAVAADQHVEGPDG